MAGEAVHSPGKVCTWLKEDTLISRHYIVLVNYTENSLVSMEDKTVLVTLKPYKWHFVFLWFLLGALPPNPWSFSGIGTSGESLKEAVFSRHRPGFRPFVHPAIP